MAAVTDKLLNDDTPSTTRLVYTASINGYIRYRICILFDAI